MPARKKGELPAALQKKRQVDKIKCTMCGKEKPITEHRYANFYKSYSQLYAGNYDGRLPVCKDCLIELHANYVKVYNSQVQALHKVCNMLDIYFNLELAKTGLQKINNDDLTTQGIIPWYMPKVTSLPYYIGKTFEDSDSLEEAVNKVATKEFKDKDLIKKWGKSYKMEELKFLEEHYAEWAEKTDCEDLVSQKFVKRICEKELAIELAKLAGKTNIDKLEDQLTKLCKEANLTPKSVTDINKNETMKIYGLWIKDIEEYRPAEYFEDKKLYKDYDGILDMFKRFILRPLKNLLTGSREFDKEFNIQKIEEELEEDKTFDSFDITDTEVEEDVDTFEEALKEESTGDNNNGTKNKE